MPDARHLRELLEQDRVPESWIPPTGVREARALVRLYKDLTEERVGWAERICATLFHQGVPRLESVLNASGVRCCQASSCRRRAGVRWRWG